MDEKARARQQHRRQRATAPTQLIAPQQFVAATETLVIGYRAVTFPILLPGKIDQFGVLMERWPGDVVKIDFEFLIEGRKIEVCQDFTLHKPVYIEQFEQEIIPPCQAFFRVKKVHYDEEFREGRRRIYTPTHFTVVFRPDQKVCTKVRSNDESH